MTRQNTSPTRTEHTGGPRRRRIWSPARRAKIDAINRRDKHLKRINEAATAVRKRWYVLAWIAAEPATTERLLEIARQLNAEAARTPSAPPPRNTA